MVEASGNSKHGPLVVAGTLAICLEGINKSSKRRYSMYSCQGGDVVTLWCNSHLGGGLCCGQLSVQDRRRRAPKLVLDTRPGELTGLTGSPCHADIFHFLRRRAQRAMLEGLT
jgi:hypothetical protein